VFWHWPALRPALFRVFLALALAFLGSAFISFFLFFALCEITTSAFPFPFGWLVLARTVFLFLFLIRIRILALFLVLARDPALVGFWRYSACIL